MGLAAKTSIDIVTQMHAAVASLNDPLAEQFSQHALAPMLTSAPGLGTVLGARILAEVGDDPHRFDTPASLRAFASTAPVTQYVVFAQRSVARHAATSKELQLVMPVADGRSGHAIATGASSSVSNSSATSTPGPSTRKSAVSADPGETLRFPDHLMGLMTECIHSTIFRENSHKTIPNDEYATAGWVDWYDSDASTPPLA